MSEEKVTRSFLREAKAYGKEVRSLLRRGRKRLAPKPLQKIELGLEELDAALLARDGERLSRAMDELGLLVDANLAFARKSSLREYAESIGLAVAIALLLRFFVVEAFKIPSGSMVPTLLVGDHIFVNKFIYGLRVPLTEKWLFHWQEPKRGDVIVFMYPQDRSKDFIKRVVGLPGDTVEIRNGELLVTNAQGQRVPIEVVTTATDFLYEEELEGQRLAIPCLQVEESLDGTKYQALYRKDDRGMRAFGPITVQPGHVFVMGDNRDNSHDSRYWGQVPQDLIKGKALVIWYSGVKWTRIGKLVD
ncbi:MAG: signal peptidase I [Myxococcota bacterium]|nr:signal peptidase I [Myxococcota bacterium]